LCGVTIGYIIFKVIAPSVQQNMQEFNKASEEAGLGKRILILKTNFLN
jgi:hypothetical protein